MFTVNVIANYATARIATTLPQIIGEVRAGVVQLTPRAASLLGGVQGAKRQGWEDFLLHSDSSRA